MKITKKLIHRIIKETLDDKRFPLKLSTVNPKVAKVVTTSGLKDGDESDDAIGVTANKTFPVAKLKPSQTSMNISKAMGMAFAMLSQEQGGKGMNTGGDLGAFISKDGHIMDGHHRWVATAMVDPTKEIGGYLVDFPGSELIKLLNAITVGRLNQDPGSGKEASGGFEQFQPEPIAKQLQQMVTKGSKHMKPELALKIIENWTGREGEEAVKAATAKFVENVSTLTFKTPPGAPERPDMPVIDPDRVKGATQIAAKALDSGEVDWKKPYAANRKDKMKVTEELIRKVVTESIKKTKSIREAFRMEADFKPGTMVNWNVLAKVVKTTSSGRQKVDYDRMNMTGAVQELIRAPGSSAVGGVAIILDPDGNSHEVEISELSHA